MFLNFIEANDMEGTATFKVGRPHNEDGAVRLFVSLSLHTMGDGIPQSVEVLERSPLAAIVKVTY